jgi:hypothetical protein
MGTMSFKSVGTAAYVSRLTMAVLAASALLPSMALAQATSSAPLPGPWKYAASVYGYVPTIGGSTVFPVDTGSSVNVTAKQILDRLKMTYMGSFEGHNGVWGVMTDLVYVDLGNTKTNSRDFTIGNIGLPVGTTANLAWDYKATVWTLAGQYRVWADSAWTVDLLAGTRLFDQRQRLNWSITGDLGPISPLSRTGKSTANQRVWDAIVGVKARYVFGAQREWSMPLYGDVGTGQSDSTVQLAAGIGYTFSWGELQATWRYVDYQAKSGKAITEMNFNGPQIGAVFRW